MARVVGIGHQDFEKVRVNHNFYIDKTAFIKEWWEACDDVTLITRPRRFGKTLNMSMVEQFFSVRYAGRGELFEGLSIWQEEKYRKLQAPCSIPDRWPFRIVMGVFNSWETAEKNSIRFFSISRSRSISDFSFSLACCNSSSARERFSDSSFRLRPNIPISSVRLP